MFPQSKIFGKIAGILLTLAPGEKQMEYFVDKNLTPSQLVVLSSHEDIAKWGMYQLGRIHEVIPQMRNGKTLVRRANVAISIKDENTGENKIIYVLRDLSCITPIENCESVEGTEIK